MTLPSRNRTVPHLAQALLVGLLLPALALAQSAKSPYRLSVFARSQNGYSQPDSIVQWGDTIVIGFQNHVAKDGTDGKSSTLVQYALNGRVIRTWSVKGHNDGLRIVQGSLWSVQNEDANPNLAIIDPAGQVTAYSFPPTVHGGGYDDLVVQSGRVFMTASNPNLDANGDNVFPALVEVRIHGHSRGLDILPVMAGNPTSTNLTTGASAKLNLTDPDSMTVDPSGNIVFTSQADGLLVFVRDPGEEGQELAHIAITSGGSPTTIDDTQFVPASPGTYMLFSDVSGDAVYRLDRPLLGFSPGTAYSNSDTLGIVATLDLDTGVLNTVASGFQSTRGMVFVVAPAGDVD